MSGRLWLTMGVLAAACAAPQVREPQPPPVHPPVLERHESVPVVTESGLYSAEEALHDTLSGELEYIGTGKWPGVERSRACAFRNQRVVIVNAYCTLYEPAAFRVDVYSPERGRVRIYAETSGAVSSRNRSDYFTFMVESSPTPSSEAHIPPLTLGMPYEALRGYEQRRYEAYLPSCYGGEQNTRRVAGCLGSLGPRAGEWDAQNRAFLERANDDWYRVIREMRTLAARYGVHVDPLR
ncbi:MAG TPA: hypothetical protein VJV78_13085 [Polyangiales bacterium]|nr:hypothetical protein [Polyangiales bacterium]